MTDTPLEIVLIGAGETEFEVEGRIRGTLNVPLSEEGRKEVEQTLKDLFELDFNVIYACSCEAAQKTAETLAKALGAKFKSIEKLPNVNLGLWQGMLLEDIKSKQPKVFKQWQEHPDTVCPPQGETPADVQERVKEVIQWLKKKHHKGGRIGLVVPEPLAGVIRNVLHNQEPNSTPINQQAVSWERIPVSLAVSS